MTPCESCRELVTSLRDKIVTLDEMIEVLRKEIASQAETIKELKDKLFEYPWTVGELERSKLKAEIVVGHFRENEQAETIKAMREALADARGALCAVVFTNCRPENELHFKMLTGSIECAKRALALPSKPSPEPEAARPVSPAVLAYMVDIASRKLEVERLKDAAVEAALRYEDCTAHHEDDPECVEESRKAFFDAVVKYRAALKDAATAAR